MDGLYKQLEHLNPIELLQLHAQILKELEQRKIIRTQNNPIGDYTEWLVSKVMNFQLASNSERGFDAIDNEGIRYQIKGRRITQGKKPRQLSAIRKLEDKDFDFLIGVIFDENYLVQEVYKIPHGIVGNYSNFIKRRNAHVLSLRGAILEDENTVEITHLFTTKKSDPI